jgi:hypothetical protein
VEIHTPGPLPIDWGLDGHPILYTDHALWPLLTLPAGGLAAYVLLRLLDWYVVGPGVNGFLSHLGAGVGVLLVLLGAGNAWSVLPPAQRAPGLVLVGLFLAALGVLALRVREVPWGPGICELLPTAAERHRAQRRLGWGLVALGLLTALLWFWPGLPAWAVVLVLALGLALALGAALGGGP